VFNYLGVPILLAIKGSGQRKLDTFMVEEERVAREWRLSGL
jgi:hypothetical protein